MNKFLKDLEKELKKLSVSKREIDEILADHKEMIEAAQQEGLSDDEISLKFGDPGKVASEIHEDSQKVSHDADFNLGDVKSLAKFDVADFNFVKSFNTLPEGLEINISLVNDDVIYSDYDGEGIMVYEKDIKDIKEYDISLNEKQFELKRKSSNKLFGIANFSNKSGEFLVLVPKQLVTESFNYKTVNGEVIVNQLIVNTSKFKSTNGEIELSNVDLGEAKMTLINGNVEIQGVKAKSMDISVVNGDIEIVGGSIEGDVHFHSVSGDVELKEVTCKTASFKTVSGDIEGKNFYVNEISLKSVSGDIDIKNDDKSKVIKVVSKKTVSGDININ